jgi:hypothetical protein
MRDGGDYHRIHPLPCCSGRRRHVASAARCIVAYLLISRRFLSLAFVNDSIVRRVSRSSYRIRALLGRFLPDSGRLWRHRRPLFESLPVDGRGARHAADDRDLRLQVFARRREQAAGRRRHRHGLFDRRRLHSTLLRVDLAARQTGQNQGLPPVNEMAAVELGGPKRDDTSVSR